MKPQLSRWSIQIQHISGGGCTNTNITTFVHRHTDAITGSSPCPYREVSVVIGMVRYLSADGDSSRSLSSIGEKYLRPIIIGEIGVH